jgi:hypothetical protein
MVTNFFNIGIYLYIEMGKLCGLCLKFQFLGAEMATTGAGAAAVCRK